MYGLEKEGFIFREDIKYDQFSPSRIERKKEKKRTKERKTMVVCGLENQRL